MTADQPTAGVALKPLDGAFVTVESTGDPKTDKRSATLKITFSGEGSSERAWAARDYLDGLVKAATRAPTDAGGAVSDAAPDLADRLRARLDLANRVSAEAEFTLDEGEIQTVLAALTPAPQAEGEAGLPGHDDQCCCSGCLAAADKPQPLQQGGEVTRAGVEYRVRLACAKATGLDAESLVGRSEAIVAGATDSILALFSSPALGDLAGLDGFLFECIEGSEDAKAVFKQWRAGLATLAADRDKAVGLLRELTPGVRDYLMTGDVMSQGIKKQTWEPVLKRVAAFLSSQTEGR